MIPTINDLNLIIGGGLGIYFIIQVLMNLVGLYIGDFEEDKKERLTNPSGRGYVYEWKELIPYAIASAAFTMSIIEVSNISFWFSIFLAWVMGAIFRTVLPTILELASTKTKAVVQVMFSK